MHRATASRIHAAMLATVVLVAMQQARAQSDASGPVALGLAGSVTARTDGRHMTFNPAADSDERTIGFCTTLSIGGLAGLGDGAVTIGIPLDSTHSLNASLGGIAYGSYRLVVLGSTICVRIGDAFDAGAGLRIESQAIDGYGASTAVLLDAGAVIRLAETIHLGVAARNVTGGRLRGMPRAQQFAIGAITDVSDSVDLSLDAVLDAGRGVTVSCATSARIVAGFEARAGLRIDGSFIGAGIGYDDGRMFVDVGLAWIDALGAQCAAGVGLRW